MRPLASGIESAGWLLFQPDYYDSDVFPSSYAEVTYYYEGISNPEGEHDVAEDYVVCVLHDRLGDELSWLGTTTYTDDWDGGSWSHVGYPGMSGAGPGAPGSCGSASRTRGPPGFFESGDGLVDIETFASLNQGDSGGPVFRWWSDGGPYDGDPAGPDIVAVVSGEGTLDPVITDPEATTGHWLAGGSEMPDLVSQALNDYP